MHKKEKKLPINSCKEFFLQLFSAFDLQTENWKAQLKKTASKLQPKYKVDFIKPAIPKNLQCKFLESDWYVLKDNIKT